MSNNFKLNKYFNIDYKFYGTYPKNIEKMNDEKIFKTFYETFFFTYINTSLSLYGNPKEVQSLVEDSLVLDRVDFKYLTKKRKWISLEIALLKLFFDLHDTIFAHDTINLVIENFKHLKDEELLTMVSDFNYSLLFSIDEQMIITPDMIIDLNAQDNDFFLLNDFLNHETQIKKIIKDYFNKDLIVESKYKEIFFCSVDNNYDKYIYNGLVLSWLDVFDYEKFKIKELNNETWVTFSTEIYSIIFIWLSLLIDEKNLEKINETTFKIYELLIICIKNNFRLSFETINISINN